MESLRRLSAKLRGKDEAGTAPAAGEGQQVGLGGASKVQRRGGEAAKASQAARVPALTAAGLQPSAG